MADYLSAAQVKDRMDRTVAAIYDDAGSLNEDWITADIETVEGLMNAYFSVRYATPVTTADDGLLRGLALDLFMEQAYRRNPGAAVPEAVAAAARRAQEMLVRVAAGAVRLGTGGEATASDSASENIVAAGNTPRLTRQRLEGF